MFPASSDKAFASQLLSLVPCERTISQATSECLWCKIRGQAEDTGRESPRGKIYEEKLNQTTQGLGRIREKRKGNINPWELLEIVTWSLLNAFFLQEAHIKDLNTFTSYFWLFELNSFDWNSTRRLYSGSRIYKAFEQMSNNNVSCGKCLEENESKSRE